MTTDFLSLGLAAAVTWSLVTTTPERAIDEASARTEAAAYLSAAPRDAQRVADQWVVTDGDDTAWLDARSGELVEIEFAAPQR